MKPLAVVIAMYCSGAMAADAADPASGDKLEEIVVTGLRQSLITSESIKRESPGVVDPSPRKISANFPIPISPNRSNAFRA